MQDDLLIKKLVRWRQKKANWDVSESTKFSALTVNGSKINTNYYGTPKSYAISKYQNYLSYFRFINCFHGHTSIALITQLSKLKIIADKMYLQYLQDNENSSRHFRKRRNIQYLRSLTFINKFSNSQNYNLIMHFANPPNKTTGHRQVNPAVLRLPKGEAIKKVYPEGLGFRLPQREQAQCKSLNEI